MKINVRSAELVGPVMSNMFDWNPVVKPVVGKAKKVKRGPIRIKAIWHGGITKAQIAASC